jgi:hypothetical protein
MTKSRIISVFLALTLLLPAAPALWGAEGTVLRVIVVQTDDVSAYLKEIERGKAMMKRLESPATTRIWRATFAGSEAGTVVVSVEYPSLAAFAKDDAKFTADSEFQAWLKGLDKIRKIVSDSLYNELTP